jgi:hypothetical protein
MPHDATSYDATPYPDLSYAHTHPDRLGVLATLLGLEPAPVERCRVLELGCGTGGNRLCQISGHRRTPLVPPWCRRSYAAASSPISESQRTRNRRRCSISGTWGWPRQRTAR